MGRKPGTPTSLTPSVQKAICEALEISVPEKYAAEANGVSEMAFHDWMRKGDRGIEPYLSFRKAVTCARAKAVQNLTKIALASGKGSSTATWFLERRYRADYGAKEQVVEPDGTLTITQRRLEPSRVNVDEEGRAVG